jgi:hypothetical protein
MVAGWPSQVAAGVANAAVGSGSYSDDTDIVTPEGSTSTIVDSNNAPMIVA